MNPRSSVGLIGVFLAIFWICGLYSAMTQTKYDETRVMSGFAALADKYVIDRVELSRTDGGSAQEYVFTLADDVWNMRQGEQSIKVEGFHVKEMINQARGAIRDEETTVADVPSRYGLAPPQATATFIGVRKKKDAPADQENPPDGKGKETPAATADKTEWKLFLGKEGADKKFVYVASSDRPGRVFAVNRSNLSSFFFAGPNDLRSKRLFDFNEPLVVGFTIKEMAPAREFEAKKETGGAWKILKPIQEFADYEGPPPAKTADPRDLPGGLKGLITAIATLRVDSDDDFIAAASDNLRKFELEPGKESLRIDISSGDPKKPTLDSLLVGKREKDFAYARLGSDEGVFKLRTKYLEPMLAALGNPAKFRSIDLSPIPIKDADFIAIKQGKDEARFLAVGGELRMPTEPRPWQIDLAGKRSPTRAKAVETLLDTLEGRRDVEAYLDGDAKKLDAELGLDAPTLVVRVYKNAIAPPKSKDDKKDSEPKADAKPEIVLEFGKIVGDQVAVKRTIEGQTDRFKVAKSVPEKIVPKEGFLAYLDLAFPRTSVGEVAKVEIGRGGKETLLAMIGGAWKLGKEKPVAADRQKVEQLLRELAAPPVVRWVKTLDPKEDLGAYGLKSPTLTLTLFEKTDRISPQTLASALGQLADVVASPGLGALAAAYANQQADPGTKSVLKIGSHAKDDDAYYATHTGTDRLGLIPARLIREIETADLRDPILALAPGYEVVAAVIGNPRSLAASPLATGVVGAIAEKAIAEVRVRVRTPVELRLFTFLREDKGWRTAGLIDFHGDDARIDQAAALAASTKVDRWVAISGGPSPEQKLTPNEATLGIDVLEKDGKQTTLTIGAEMPGVGYFATSSDAPGAVFILATDRVRPMLAGAAFFSKERIARAE